MICTAATITSAPSCGLTAWVPGPLSSTEKLSPLAQTTPGLTTICPTLV